MSRKNLPEVAQPRQEHTRLGDMLLDPVFQSHVLAVLLHDHEFARQAVPLLEVRHFSASDMQDIFVEVKWYWGKYRTVPSPDDIDRLFRVKVKNSKLLVEEYKPLRRALQQIKVVAHEIDPSFVKDTIKDFVRGRAFEQQLLQAVQLARDGKWESIVPTVRKAELLGNMDQADGHFFFSQTDERDKWFKRQAHNRVPTMLRKLDRAIGGGITPGELWVCMSPTNRGKSHWLDHVGSVGPILGMRTLHATWEMAKEEVAERYEALYTNLLFNRLPKKRKTVHRIIEKQLKVFGDNLHICEFRRSLSTLDDLAAYIERLKYAYNWLPEFLVIDYGDVIAPSHRYKEKRFELSSVFQEMVDLSKEQQLPTWTATQANRASVSKKVVTMADVAEDFGKVQIATGVIALCQTEEEYEQDLMRIFIAKSRKQKRNKTIDVATDFARSKFLSPERDRLLGHDVDERSLELDQDDGADDAPRDSARDRVNISDEVPF